MDEDKENNQNILYKNLNRNVNTLISKLTSKA